MPEIRRFVSTEVPVLLVGTKEDLIENSPPELLVDIQRAAEVATEVHQHPFIQFVSDWRHRLLVLLGLDPSGTKKSFRHGHLGRPRSVEWKKIS